MRRSATILIVLGFVLAGLSGCDTGAPATGFEIYLLAQDIPPEWLILLSHLELQAEPLLSSDDVVSYREDTHEIELTAAGVEAIRSLEVPVDGTSFAVCVDGQPVYGGAFWAAYSSLSFDGVVIETTRASEEHPVIRIELGYPGPDFFRGADPRPDPKVLRALEQAGKPRKP